MTFNELMKRVLRDYPDGEIGEDNDGQLVIYTGLEIDFDGEQVVDFVPNGEG